MATITNVIRNPSFETNTTDWSASGSPTLTRIASNPYAGTYSYRAVGNALNGGYESGNTIFAVTQGQTWTASVYVIGSGTLYLRIRECDVSGAFVNEVGTSNTVLTGAVQRLTLTRTVAGATTAFLRLRLLSAVASAFDFYSDGWMLQQGSEATAYFDGTYPGAVWTGTAHASTSVLTIPDVSTVFHLGSSRIGPLKVGQGA